MNSNFKFKLARLLFMISAGLVLIVGLAFQVAIEALLIRTLVGATIFTTISYVLGMIIDKENKKIVMANQKKKLQKKIIEDYEKAKEEGDQEFEEMDVDQLTRIVIDSMDEDDD